MTTLNGGLCHPTVATRQKSKGLNEKLIVEQLILMYIPWVEIPKSYRVYRLGLSTKYKSWAEIGKKSKSMSTTCVASKSQAWTLLTLAPLTKRPCLSQKPELRLRCCKDFGGQNSSNTCFSGTFHMLFCTLRPNKFDTLACW